MLPPPIEHRFTIEGEPYLLVEWDRGGERRIRSEYAIAIAPAPQVMESLDGASLYSEAVARECLKEAPEYFWTTRTPAATLNGTPTRVVSLEHVPRVIWEQFRQEVDTFLGKIFPTIPETIAPAPQGRPEQSLAVATPQNVSAGLRGRAE